MGKNKIIPIVGVMIVVMTFVLFRNYNSDIEKRTKQNKETSTVKIPVQVKENVQIMTITNLIWSTYELKKNAGNVHVEGINVSRLKMRWKTEIDTTWTYGSSIYGINNITILELKLDDMSPKNVKIKLFQKK